MSANPPPPGPQYSGKMPIQNRHQILLIVLPAVFLTVATVAVVLRFYARHLKQAKALADDYFCVLALIIGYGSHATIVTMVVGGGMGLHIWNLTTDIQWFLFRVGYIFWFIFITGIG